MPLCVNRSVRCDWGIEIKWHDKITVTVPALKLFPFPYRICRTFSLFSFHYPLRFNLAAAVAVEGDVEVWKQFKRITIFSYRIARVITGEIISFSRLLILNPRKYRWLIHCDTDTCFRRKPRLGYHEQLLLLC